MTPVVNIRSPRDESFNTAHRVTRCTIERCIGILKRRWYCLDAKLKVTPEKACEIICACVVLNNHAIHFSHDDEDLEENGGGDDGESADAIPVCTISEQARLAAGKAARDRLINSTF